MTIVTTIMTKSVRGAAARVLHVVGNVAQARLEQLHADHHPRDHRLAVAAAVAMARGAAELHRLQVRRPGVEEGRHRVAVDQPVGMAGMILRQRRADVIAEAAEMAADTILGLERQ